MVAVFCFIFYSLFSVCVLGSPCSVDDEEKILSALVYAWTPVDKMLSPDHSMQQHKLEDFIKLVSMSRGYNSILGLIQLEINKRSVGSVLEYLSYHRIEGAADALAGYNHELSIRDLMLEWYDTGRRKGLRDNMINALQLTTMAGGVESLAGQLTKYLQSIKDIDISERLGEIMLYGIRLRLSVICDTHNIKPVFAYEKGLHNKVLNYLIAKGANICVNTGGIGLVLSSACYCSNYMFTSHLTLEHTEGYHRVNESQCYQYSHLNDICPLSVDNENITIVSNTERKTVVFSQVLTKESEQYLASISDDLLYVGMMSSLALASGTAMGLGFWARTYREKCVIRNRLYHYNPDQMLAPLVKTSEGSEYLSRY